MKGRNSPSKSVAPICNEYLAPLSHTHTTQSESQFLLLTLHPQQCFCFQNEIKHFLDTLTQKLFFQLIEINDFLGDLTDTSALKQNTDPQENRRRLSLRLHSRSGADDHVRGIRTHVLRQQLRDAEHNPHLGQLLHRYRPHELRLRALHTRRRGRLFQRALLPPRLSNLRASVRRCGAMRPRVELANP